MNSEINVSKCESIKTVKLITLPLSIFCFDCQSGRLVCGLNQSYICLNEKSNPTEFGCSLLKEETAQTKVKLNLN